MLIIGLVVEFVLGFVGGFIAKGVMLENYHDTLVDWDRILNERSRLLGHMTDLATVKIDELRKEGQSLKTQVDELRKEILSGR